MHSYERNIITTQSCTQSVEDGIWNVQSQSGHCIDGYSVCKKSTACSLPGCSIKCTKPECDFLCRHMYSCECYDYANGHICKHVHAVHMQIKADTTTCVEASYAEAVDDLTLITPALSEKENLLPGSYKQLHHNNCLTDFDIIFPQCRSAAPTF